MLVKGVIVLHAALAAACSHANSHAGVLHETSTSPVVPHRSAQSPGNLPMPSTPRLPPYQALTLCHNCKPSTPLALIARALLPSTMPMANQTNQSKPRLLTVCLCLILCVLFCLTNTVMF